MNAVLPTAAAPVTQITPDIYQIELPLPFALRSVNCYLLRGSQGWTILDTGLNTRAGRAAWTAAFAALSLAPGDVEQILVSHIHPDHVGMAGWLQAHFRTPTQTPPVYLSPRSVEEVAKVWAATAGDQEQAAFFLRCGLDAESAQAAVTEMGPMRLAVQPLPTVVQTMQPGSTVRLGDRQFQAIHAPGHSDGQLIFYDPADRLILCADQVLMRISPNISIWPSTEPSPLRRYLASLHELAQLEVDLALPGHGRLIDEWVGRLGEIAAHHRDRLDEMVAAVEVPSTVAEISRRVFDHDRLSTHEIRFAVTETLAHLCYLVEEGRLMEEGDGPGGVMRFRRDRGWR